METNQKEMNIKRLLITMAQVQIVAVIVMFVSPFIWIWYDGYTATKVFGSGALAFGIVALVYKLGKSFFADVVEEEEQRASKIRKSRWQQKLEKIQAEHKQKQSSGKINETLDEMLAESSGKINETLDEMLADSIKEDTK